MSSESISAPPRDQGGADMNRMNNRCLYVKALEVVIAGLHLVEIPFEIIFWQIHGLRTRLEVALLSLCQ